MVAGFHRKAPSVSRGAAVEAPPIDRLIGPTPVSVPPNWAAAVPWQAMTMKRLTAVCRKEVTWRPPFESDISTDYVKFIGCADRIVEALSAYSSDCIEISYAISLMSKRQGV